MAERRMFAKTIIDSDAFLDMPMSAQCLYFHLAMRADDEGFVNSPKKVQRMVGASDDDAKILLAKNFVIAFETGVIVIKHWRIHNYIQNDRFKPTAYRDERERLSVKPNGAYTLDTNCIQDVSKVETQVRLGKDSIGKDRLGKDSKGGSGGKTQFSPPTREQIAEYCEEQGISIDVDYFYDHYSGNGWRAGRVPMKDWKATVRNWYRRDKKQNGAKIKTPYDNIRTETNGDDADRLARMMGVHDG